MEKDLHRRGIMPANADSVRVPPENQGELTPGVPLVLNDIFMDHESRRPEKVIEGIASKAGMDFTELLEAMYQANMSTYDMGNFFRVSSTTIHKWMINRGIELRPVGGVKGIKQSPQARAKISVGQKNNWGLNRERRVKLSTNPSIKARQSEAQKSYTKMNPELVAQARKKGGKTRSQNRHEALVKLFGGEPNEVLRKLYVDDNLSAQDIADKYHLNIHTVESMLRGIKKTGRGEKANLKTDKKIIVISSTSIAQLDNTSQSVLTLRYLSAKPMTLAAVGRHLNLSRQRVHQIEEKAIQRLRDQAKL